MANPENVFERVDPLLRIQARALETWHFGQGWSAQMPRNDGLVTTALEPFELDNNLSERWEETAELINSTSDAVSGDAYSSYFS